MAAEMKVTDAAVEAALVAYVNAWDVSVTGAEKCVTSWDDEQVNHARVGVRAALEAALAAMLEPAVYQSRVSHLRTGHEVTAWHNVDEQMFSAVNGQPHEGKTLRVEYRTLYRIKP